MSLRQRALTELLKELGGAMAVGAVIAMAINIFGLAWTAIVVTAVIMAYLIKMQYDIKLRRLEWEQERIARALKEDAK